LTLSVTDMSLKLSREETREMLWKLIKNNAKMQIFNAFDMYGRMSLTELADRLYKSKSTVHTHLGFLLKLGIVKKERVPLDSNTNVYENYYELADNIDEIFGAIDYDYQPFEKLTKEQVQKMIEPAIAMSRVLKSFYETHIRYLEAIRDSGFDEEAVNSINQALKWVEDKDGNPVLLARNSFSFNFYSEREFFQEKDRILKINRDNNLNWDAILEEEDETNQIERPLLIITSTMPYGYYLEYLNTQKKKSYQT
jgi:predicted transcriptional regulator